MPLKLDTRAFIEKALTVHGNRYDYSCSEYVSSATPISVICPHHGVFRQIANNHLRGSGCAMCRASERRGAKMNTLLFIEKARAVHGERYDYSAVQYASAVDKVSICCLVHGMFEQGPYCHLGGSGCPVCADRKPGRINRRFGLDEWLKRFNEIHGNKYIYPSPSPLLLANDKLLIVCPYHGEFYQNVCQHSKGANCPYCCGGGFRRSEWVGCQRGRKATLYIIEIKHEAEAFYKIGITYNLPQRFRTSASMPYPWRTVATYRSDDAGEVYDLEKQLHRELGSLRYTPKRPFGGQTECFSSIVSIIKTMPTGTFFLRNWSIA